VTAAASLAHPEFAAVCASVFGVVTILLARLFLGERVRPPQWAAITAIFGAVGYLGL
jgi:drug/metabolite transporter (DMT)-like permease